MADSCEETTVRLNCGCCEDLILKCERPKGHIGIHIAEIEAYDPRKDYVVKYQVKWMQIGQR